MTYASKNPAAATRQIMTAAGVSSLLPVLFAAFSRRSAGYGLSNLFAHIGVLLFWLSTFAIVTSLIGMIFKGPKSGRLPLPLIVLGGVVGSTLVASYVTNLGGSTGVYPQFIGGALFLVVAIWNLIETKFVTFVTVNLLSMIFGLACASVVWGSRYQSPLFVEALIAGEGHLDTYYHAALANGIRTHGIATTMIDGIKYTPYHFGSHWFFVQWANLTNTSVLDTYNIGYPLIVGALLIVATATFALSFLPTPESDTNEGVTGLSKGTWIAMLLGMMTVFPNDVAEAAHTGLRYLSSESYILAIVFMLLSVAAFVDLMRTVAYGPRSVLQEVLVLCFIPFGIVTAMWIKVSVGSLMWLALVFACFRFVELRRWFVWAGLSIATILALVFRTNWMVKGYSSGLAFFALIRASVPTNWTAYFFPVFFFSLLVYLAIRFREEHLESVESVRQSILGRRIRDVELLLLVAGVGTAIPCVINIPGGSGYYFADVHRWPALVLVAVWIGNRLPHIEDFRSLKGSAGEYRLRPIGVWVGLTVVVWSVGLQIAENVGRAAERTLNIRDLAAGVISQPVALRNRLRNQAGMASDSAAEPVRQAEAGGCAASLAERQDVVQALAKLSALPLRERRTAMLDIPHSVRGYWCLHMSGKVPAQPFVVPALTGLALLDGLPAPQKIMPYYSYEIFGFRKEPQQQGDARDEELERRALEYGAERLIRFRVNEAAELTLESKMLVQKQ